MRIGEGTRVSSWQRESGGEGAPRCSRGLAAAYPSGATASHLNRARRGPSGYRFLWLAVCVTLVWCSMPAPVRAGVGVAARVLAVVDGDSLEVRAGDEKLQVRLHGIDCPEWDQPHGAEAREFTTVLALGRMVKLLTRDEDAYGRRVAEVLLEDGRSLNRELVRAGHAWWYRRYSAAPDLERLEGEARAAGRGLWRHPDPVPPWVWRRDHPRD